MRILLIALLLFPAAALAQAGRFLLAVGEVTVVRAAGAFKPSAGTPLQAGDLIRLGERSNAQIRLSDESIVALRSGTELRIDDYSFTGRAEESKSFFSLLRGGLRTVTGAIGALRDRERYQIRTPTATIGIRGTHYVLAHCDGNCGAGVQDGTYGGVSDGRIGVENQTGERQFGAQEFFHVAGADAVPQGLIAPPAFLYDRLEGQERSRGRAGAETSENMARSGLDAESRPSSVPTPPELPSFVVTEQRDAAGDLVALPVSVARAGGIALSASPGIDLADFQDAENVILTLDATGTRLEGFSATNSFGDSVTTSRGIASFADTGSDATGEVFWGRWTPGATADIFLVGASPQPGLITPPTGIHWIFGDATLPATIAAKAGSVGYDYVGGTNPTDDLGNVGAMNAGSTFFTVDFTARSVSGQLDYAVGGVGYTISVSAPITFLSSKAVFTDVRDNPGGGTCTACAGAIDLTSVGGTFYGAGGAGLGVTFATDDASAGATAGVAHFGAVPPPAFAFAFSEPAHDVGDVSGTQATLTLDAATRTVLEAASGVECLTSPCQPYSLSRNGAAIADLGGDTSVASVRWGRWAAGALWSHPADGTTTPPTGVHWMFGNHTPFDTVAARTGISTYAYVGGTRPTDHAGNLGTMADSSFSIDFVGRLVTGSINYSVGGANYNVGVPGVPIVASNGQAIFSYNPINSGSFCNICDEVAGRSASVGGTFMGPQGDGLAVTWATHHGIRGQTAGSGYFTATSVPTPTTALVLALTHASGTRDDPAAFVVPSNLTTAGAGTTSTLQAFTVPSFAHIDLTAGALSGTAGGVTNQTTANSLNAYWGRWAGGSMTDSFDNTSFSATNQLHYIVAPLTPDTVIAAKTGSFAFNLVGGTTPTNNIGEAASSFSVGPLSIDFTARTVSWPATTFDFPSQNWSFPTTTSAINIDTGRGAFTDNNITGTCGPITGCNGSARLVRTGVFMGPAGDHLGVSMQARTLSGTQASMQGAAIFACSPTC